MGFDLFGTIGNITESIGRAFIPISPTITDLLKNVPQTALLGRTVDQVLAATGAGVAAVGAAGLLAPVAAGIAIPALPSVTSLSKVSLPLLQSQGANILPSVTNFFDNLAGDLNPIPQDAAMDDLSFEDES